MKSILKSSRCFLDFATQADSVSRMLTIRIA